MANSNYITVGDALRASGQLHRIEKIIIFSSKNYHIEE
jgi:hypothetical protein